jgi:hypothetical protein
VLRPAHRGSPQREGPVFLLDDRLSLSNSGDRRVSRGAVRLLAGAYRCHGGFGGDKLFCNFDPTRVTLIGYFTEIQTDTLSADRKTYDGTFAIQNFDLSGNHVQGQDLSGTVHSTRFTVP